MSGVITGPYFLKFFDEPTALEVGTMVAVLEIGAFSELSARAVNLAMLTVHTA